MTFLQELRSWLSPPDIHTKSLPSIGSFAPSNEPPPLPNHTRKPTLVTFLRHCGCPFAEKSFLRLRSTATSHPGIYCVAISHSDKTSTDRWVEAVGGAGPIDVIVDDERKLYAEWGLGTAGWGHVLDPRGMWNVFKLGRDEGIWNRPTESGSRWQTSGSCATDARGIIIWGRGIRSRLDS